MIPLAKFAMVRARAAAHTIVFFDSSTASYGPEITMPASVLANDLAILVDYQYGTGTAPASVYPSGWTAIGSSVTVDLTDSGFKIRINVSYKVLAGTEGGSTITGMDGAYDGDKVLLVFRPSGGAWGSPSSVNAVAQDSDPSNQTVTVGTAPGLVVGWAADPNVTGVTMSPVATATVSEGGLQVGRIIYNQTPANNTVSTAMPFGGSLGSFWLPLGA